MKSEFKSSLIQSFKKRYKSSFFADLLIIFAKNKKIKIKTNILFINEEEQLRKDFEFTHILIKKNSFLNLSLTKVI